MNELFTDLDGLVDRIPDGVSLVVPPDYSGCAMAAVRRLIQRGARRLHLIGSPIIGFQGDMLIGAGCVETVECAAVTLGEYGPAPRFSEAVRTGAVRIKDATCPAIHSGLQAAEKGIPFIPLRGIIGSDILKQRDDWMVIDNPFGENDPIVVLPAIKPDFALIHAAKVDRNGNVWVGVRREMMLLAHAARETLVTYEEVYDGDLLKDEALAAGTIPGLYVSALAEAEQGAWPIGLAGRYGPDGTHLRTYADMAATRDGFARYLEQFVYQRIAAE